MQTRLTNTERQQLHAKIVELNQLNPDWKNGRLFEESLKQSGLEGRMSNSSGNASIYVRKALGLPMGEGGKTRKESNSEMPPETAIANYEKMIQHEILKLDARRNELMEKVRHLDDIIAKYRNSRK